MKRLFISFVIILMGLGANARDYDFYVFGRQVTDANKNDILGDGTLSATIWQNGNAIVNINELTMTDAPSWASATERYFIEINKRYGTSINQVNFVISGLCTIGAHYETTLPYYDPSQYSINAAFDVREANTVFEGHGQLWVQAAKYAIYVEDASLTLRTGFHHLNSFENAPIYHINKGSLTRTLVVGDNYAASLSCDKDDYNLHPEILGHHSSCYSAIYFSDKYDYHLQDICNYYDHPFCYAYLYGAGDRMRHRLEAHGVRLLWGDEDNVIIWPVAHSAVLQGIAPVKINDTQLAYNNLRSLFRDRGPYAGKMEWNVSEQELHITSATSIDSLTFSDDVATIRLDANLAIYGSLKYKRDLRIIGPGRLFVSNMERTGTGNHSTTQVIGRASIFVDGSMAFSGTNNELYVDVANDASVEIRTGVVSGLDYLNTGGYSIPGGFYLNTTSRTICCADGTPANSHHVEIRKPRAYNIKIDGNYITEGTKDAIPTDQGTARYANDTLYLNSASIGDVEKEDGNLVIYNTGTSRIDNVTGSQLKLMNADQYSKLAIFETVRVTPNGSLYIENGKVSVNVMGKQYGIGSTISGNYFPMTVKNATVTVDSSIEAIHEINSFTTGGTALMSPVGAHFEYSKKAIVDATNYRIKSLTIAPGGTASQPRSEIRMYMIKSGNTESGYTSYGQDVINASCRMFYGGNYYDCPVDSVWMGLYVKTINPKSVPTIRIEKYSPSTGQWSSLSTYLAPNTTEWASGKYLTDETWSRTGILNTYWGTSTTGMTDQTIFRALVTTGTTSNRDTLAISNPVTVNWFYPHALQGPMRYSLSCKNEKIPSQKYSGFIEEGDTEVIYGKSGDSLMLTSYDDCHPAYSVIGTQLGTYAKRDAEGKAYIVYDNSNFTEVLSSVPERWTYTFYERYDSILGRPVNTLAGGLYQYIECGQTFEDLSLSILDNEPTRENDTFLGWAMSINAMTDMSVYYSSEFVKSIGAPSYESLNIDGYMLDPYDMRIDFVGVWLSDVPSSDLEGLENVYRHNEELQKTHKILYNGQVLIIRNGKWYNVTGTMIE